MGTSISLKIRLTPSEFAAKKALHTKARAHLTSGEYAHRYALLAWLFVRGQRYRRGERHRHVQLVPATYKGYSEHPPKTVTLFRKDQMETVHYIEHNGPSASRLLELLVEIGAVDPKTGKATVERWLSEPIDANDLVPVLGRKLDAKARMLGIQDEPTVEAGPATMNALVAASVADAAE